jgi:hypothetical protein
VRRADGKLYHRALEVLDLHYLLSFYGNDGRLEPQLLLGAAVVALREQPLITPRVVGDAKEANPESLAMSNLEEQRPAVQITHEPLSLEEMSKLWTTMIQTRYLLSTTCVCRGVFLEGDREGPPLPPPGKPHVRGP